MSAEDFAVDLGCPEGKGCEAWCHSKDRSDFSVILGAEVAEKVMRDPNEVYGPAKFDTVIGAWRVLSAPKTRRNRRPRKDDTPEAPTLHDQRPEGRAARRARQQAKTEARAAKKVLTLGDSEDERTDRIDAVVTAIAAIPVARAALIRQLRHRGARAVRDVTAVVAPARRRGAARERQRHEPRRRPREAR